VSFQIHVLPSHPQWGNFRRALTLIAYGTYLKNSIVLAAIFSSLVTLTSSLVGFAFARLRGPGREQLFGVLLATMMIPPIITIIPTYVLFARVGLIDTYWPWVLWGLAASPFLTFLFRQFYSSMPIELEDAAIVDGAGYLRIYLSIFVPLSRPVIATSIVLSFTWVWGDFVAPAIFLSPAHTTLAVAMANGYTDAQGRILPHILAAGVIFYVLPVAGVFFLAQRAFTQNLISSGLKG
jgi:ABC-type glycerol-3-phosphate transport system permease component